MTRKLLSIGSLLAGFALVQGRALAQGCAMCGTAVQDPADPLARSLSSSVLFMMSMPFFLLATVGGWLVYRHRRPGDRTEENPD